MNKLKIVTWNIGFGAMGSEAEVKMDGGRRFIPSSRAHIKKNMQGILEYVRSHDADVFLLQEVSFGSLLNYWHNVEHTIRKVLESFHIHFASNFKFPLWVRFLRNEHGISTYVRHAHEIQHLLTHRYKSSEVYYRVIRRKDRFIATAVTPKGGSPIVVINTHLASFDTDGAIRKQQCSEVLAYAEELHDQGHRVLIGADWNMRIAPEEFATPSLDVRYRHNFPLELLKEGWQLHSPSGIPTVRSANEPYQTGKTTTSIIDGFVCSPGVTVQNVTVRDLEFQFSDHQPVEIEIVY